MANSGLKKVTKLRKYVNGNPTDEVKDNLITDSDYIPNYISKKECPVGCDAIVSGSVYINAQSSGQAVFTFPTTTTTTTAHITTIPPALSVRDYSLENYSQSEQVVIRYIDQYGVSQEITIPPDTSYGITSSSEPYRISGTTQISIVADGPIYVASTTTTTIVLQSSDDYLIDNTNGTESVIVSLTQMGSSTPIETEIKPGKSVSVISDTPVVRLSGEQSVSIVKTKTATEPTENTYTITNNSSYESEIVEYRPYLGVTDEIELSPGESIVIKSQDPPKTYNEVPFDTFTGNGIDDTFQLATAPKNQNNIQVYIDDTYQGVEEYEVSGTNLIFNTPPAANSNIEVTETKLSITSVGTPTQQSQPSTIEKRICNQNVIYNDSEYTATFEYQNCDQENEKIKLEPHESATVASIGQPTLLTSESPSVGNSYAVETVEKTVGTSGSATPVTPTTTTTTTRATTTTTKAPNTQQNVVQNVVTNIPKGEPQDLKEISTSSHSTSKWWPKSVKISIDKKTGTFKFISYDHGTIGIVYRVYDGSNLLLDTCILTNAYSGRYQQITRTDMISEGFSNTQANQYCNDNGTKRSEPQKLGRVRRSPAILGWKELYNPFGQKHQTEFELNKVTTNDYVTVEVWQATHWGSPSGANSAYSYTARFEVTGVY